MKTIVCVDNNWGIGSANDLLYHIPDDMKFFKEMTMNKTIIMGRKCFESLPGLLPNRKHIILSNNKNYKINNALIMNDFNTVLDYIKNTDEECFIIGGAKIYDLFLPYCNKLYITEIDESSDADVYFPKFDKEKYKRSVIDRKCENNINYSFVLYERK